jgi:hypothetical protein
LLEEQAVFGFWGSWVEGPDVHWTEWHTLNPPPVYLTNWGFVATLAYMATATTVTFAARFVSAACQARPLTFF